jgi:hypothetical protein
VRCGNDGARATLAHRRSLPDSPPPGRSTPTVDRSHPPWP